MAVVVFDPVAFVGRYPEFTQVPAYQLTAFFDEACIYLSNEDSSPVSNVSRRAFMLNMLTAHVAYLAGVLNADGMPRPVGRVSSATEGSVSATFEGVPPTPGSGAWFNQTQYGAAFWQASSWLRSFQYFPCPTMY